MSKLEKILFYYCLFFALFVIVSGIANSKSASELLLQIIFLPVIGYLLYTVIEQRRKKQPAQAQTQEPPPNKKNISLFAVAIFLLLVTVSIIKINQKPKLQKPIPSLETQTTRVLSKKTPLDTTKISSNEAVIAKNNSQYPTPTAYLIIKTDDDRSKVNVREQAKNSARVIKKTTAGQTYPLVAKKDKWFEILLEDKSHGFIFEEFGVATTKP